MNSKISLLVSTFANEPWKKNSYVLIFAKSGNLAKLVPQRFVFSKADISKVTF